MKKTRACKSTILLRLFILCNGLLLCLSSCSRLPGDVEDALQRAGANRIELEKVIEHFRNDPDARQLFSAGYLKQAAEMYAALDSELLKDPEVQFNYAQLLSELDSLPQAIILMENATITSNNSIYLTTKADMLYKNRDYHRAEQSYIYTCHKYGSMPIHPAL